jgi:hypothetical protein
MARGPTDGHYRERAAVEPDLNLLREEFLWAVEKRDSNFFRRARLNYNTRYCIWANQSSDGRKWQAFKGQEIFPWPGASDARVPLVDMFINEDVAKLMVVWRRMKVIATGTESNDADFGHRITQVLRWMKYTQMREARREMRLLANTMLERGAAALGIFWEKRRQLGYETVDLEDITAAAMETAETGQAPAPDISPEEMLALPKVILDPSQEKAVCEIAAKLYPDVAKARLLKAVKDLRTAGVARFPRPYVVMNRPVMVAFALNEDLFVAPEATDIRQARTIDRLELLTESDLMERQGSQGWDAAWVNEMIETQRGKLPADFDGQMLRANMTRVNSRGVLNTDRLFAVVHGYRRRHDEDGVPGLYYTCYSPFITGATHGHHKGYAYHSLLDYDHGEQPFTLFERETRSRLLDDARGMGEVLATHQQQIKAEWDSRIDRSSIATLPPFHHPEGEAPDKWGPGVKIGTMRPEDYGFVDIPKWDPGSGEVQQFVGNFARRYAGRFVEEENNQIEAQIVGQDLADNFMGSCAEADTHILKLCQQYMPEEFYYRVVGSSKAKSIRGSREEIQGAFDVSVSYNVSDLDPEQVEKKLGYIEKALQWDITGRVDRDEVLTVGFEMIDPNMGERVLRPAEEAAQAEIEDEDNVLSKMASGIGTDVKPGQAYQMRLQRLQQRIMGSEKLKRMYQQDEEFKELVDNRMKQLGHQLEQRENAKIGRLGGEVMG